VLHSSDVVKLKNDGVILATIDTGMFRQIITDQPSVASDALPLGRL
jgi:hypothetical protein